MNDTKCFLTNKTLKAWIYIYKKNFIKVESLRTVYACHHLRLTKKKRPEPIRYYNAIRYKGTLICIRSRQDTNNRIIPILITTLLLDVNDDNTKSSYKTQGLDTEEPKEHPEDEHHHRLYNLLSKVKLCEAHASQALIEHTKQSTQPLTVIHLCCLWYCIYRSLRFRRGVRGARRSCSCPEIVLWEEELD